MLRIGLFLLTNIGVLVVASITLNLLGVNHILDESGSGLNLKSLLIFCAVFGFSGSFISLFLSKFIAKKTTGTQIIDTPRTAEQKWLLDTVAELSQKAGIGMPEVGIFPAPEANAFATGWNRNKSLVAVSAGLLQRFDREEARAVLAHEIGHVANGDMVTLTLIQGVVNTFVMFFARIIGHTVDRVVFKTERGLGIGYYVVTFVAEIVLAFLASMIVMAFSRYREYRADQAGANLASRAGMIRALQRLQAETQAGAQSSMPSSMKAFGISSGFSQNMAKLFASHPPLEERIRALQQGG
ncbi:protease HtpX [Gilvimarinus sp. SDUM040013]|uniref:Protease HtpX n=1 Tax=Gilvimarinus gilvus TaxID=3058038 RepID=A0ABU4RZN6_9GAMM|nr:protease HtpX [Gilvimarinus sp. SDUM040013]MDO3386108.1 protease HtpX [Gilvimarinus sp. SDUM040013]MDX6850351.1 protease HtpX [Gilvimarinus sp. SDUM040013]